jgi:hypothetical protein
MTTKQQPDKQNKENTMEWLSWTTPLGSGLFILALSCSFYLFSKSIDTLAKTGKTGKEIEEMEKE